MRRCSNSNMKGYYIVFDSSFNHNEGNGINNKIQQQIEALRNEGFSCSLINLVDYWPFSWKNLSTPLKFLLTSFPSLMTLRTIDTSVDFLYIRKPFPCSPALLFVLKYFKKHNKKIKIILEIPTYPYDVEQSNTIVQKIKLYFDKKQRKKLKLFVDRIASFSKDERIFSIPTIQITNGVDLSKIPIVKKKEKNENEIHLIAVAQFGPWHGYDRLIKGLNLYYKNHKKTKTYLHLVGDGKELDLYKNYIIDYKLEDYVYVHGKKFGNELTEIFNTADIAISSLGNHRKKLFLSSELKSREYLARALPIVSSTKIDIIPEGFPYCLYVPEDESPIDIEALIQFYKNLQNEKNYTKKIRAFAEEHVGMDKTMQPVFKYLLETPLKETHA